MLCAAYGSADGHVTTVAGTGAQWMQVDGFPSSSSPYVPLSCALATSRGTSPGAARPSWSLRWPVSTSCGPSTRSPAARSLSVVAGTQANEGLRDGPPAGGVVGTAVAASRSTGTGLWFARLGDLLVAVVARTASSRPHVGAGALRLRARRRSRPTTRCSSTRSGSRCCLTRASVVLADTYNGAVRRFDPVTRRRRHSRRLASGREPIRVTVLDSDGDTLLVVESAAHRLVADHVTRQGFD